MTTPAQTEIWSYKEVVVYEIYHPKGHVIGSTTDEVEAAEIVRALNNQQAVGEEPDWAVDFVEPEHSYYDSPTN